MEKQMKKNIGKTTKTVKEKSPFTKYWENMGEKRYKFDMKYVMK